MKHRNRQARLDLQAVARDGPSLMDKDWLGELKPNLGILQSSTDENLQSLLRKCTELVVQRRTGPGKRVNMQLNFR